MLSRDVCAAPSLTASLTTTSGLVPPCHQLPRYMLFRNAGGDCLFSSFGTDVRLGPLMLTRTVPADVHEIRLAVTARLQQHLEKDEKVSLMAAAFFYLSQIEKTKASGVLLEAYAGLVTVAESLEAEAMAVAQRAAEACDQADAFRAEQGADSLDMATATDGAATYRPRHLPPAT